MIYCNSSTMYLLYHFLWILTADNPILSLVYATIIIHLIFSDNILCHQIDTLLRLMGKFTHDTIVIAYSFLIFQHPDRCFFVP